MLLIPHEDPVLESYSARLFDLETGQAFAERILRLAKESGRDALHLDLAGVDFVTAADLGSFVTLRNHLLANGVTLTLCNVKGSVYKVIQMTGLTRMLNARLKQPTLPVRFAASRGPMLPTTSATEW